MYMDAVGGSDLWEVRIRREGSWHIVTKPKRLRTGMRPDWTGSLAGNRLVFGAGDEHFSIGMLELNPNLPKPVGQTGTNSRDDEHSVLGTCHGMDGILPTLDLDDFKGFLRNLETGKEEDFELPEEGDSLG